MGERVTFCPACGGEVQWRSTMCRHCGEARTPDKAPPAARAAPAAPVIVPTLTPAVDQTVAQRGSKQRRHSLLFASLIRDVGYVLFWIGLAASMITGLLGVWGALRRTATVEEGLGQALGSMTMYVGFGIGTLILGVGVVMVVGSAVLIHLSKLE